MATNPFIDMFPLFSVRMLRVPAVPPGEVSPAYVSYDVDATQVAIPTLVPDPNFPNKLWEPVVAISVLPCEVAKIANNGKVSINDSLRNASFWLTEMMNPLGIVGPVPQVEYQVRAAVGTCTPEVIASGTIKLTGYSQMGLIVQVDNFLCTQFEFWARVDSASPNAHPVTVRLQVIADRFVGTPRSIYKGSVSI